MWHENQTTIKIEKKNINAFWGELLLLLRSCPWQSILSAYYLSSLLCNIFFCLFSVRRWWMAQQIFQHQFWMANDNTIWNEKRGMKWWATQYNLLVCPSCLCVCLDDDAVSITANRMCAPSVTFDIYFSLLMLLLPSGFDCYSTSRSMLLDSTMADAHVVSVVVVVEYFDSVVLPLLAFFSSSRSYTYVLLIKMCAKTFRLSENGHRRWNSIQCLVSHQDSLSLSLLWKRRVDRRLVVCMYALLLRLMLIQKHCTWVLILYITARWPQGMKHRTSLE